MAGIEKICEFSGNYPGGDMWGYKYNHIQIEPKWRKYFKHTKDPILYICKSKSYVVKNPERKCFKFMDGCIVKKSSFDWTYFLYTPNLPSELTNTDLLDDENNIFTISNTCWYESNCSSDIRPVIHNMKKLTSNSNLKIKKLSTNSFYSLFDKLSSDFI
jgi:hypothetical protein